MQGRTLFEKSRVVDRLKAAMTLGRFILAAALASVRLMDAVVSPIALLAVNDKPLFNIIVVWGIRLGIAGALVYLFARRIFALRRDGLSGSRIALPMLVRPLQASGLVLSLLVVSTAVIALIYILFSYNYYFIYKLSN